MPKENVKKIEAKLKKEAKQKGLTGARADAYTYGTLRKMGSMPKPKGQ